MGIFSNFFKSQPLPEDEIQESENVMRKLQEKRQANTSQWVASIQDPNSMMPTTWTKIKNPPIPTIEDVDQREEADGFIYTPPAEAMYTPFDDDDTLGGLARTKNSSAADWVSKIFQEFEHQGNIFNASAQGTNLVLSIHPPQYTEEVLAGGVYGKEKKVRFFKGYVSTTFWGMLLHGHHDKIDIYIVPSEAILQLTLSDIDQSGFGPFITIDSLIKNGELEWHVGGTTISYEAIANLAKELLGDLIKVASGKLKADELFCDHESGLKLDQGAAQNLSQVLRIKDTASAPDAAVATATRATPSTMATSSPTTTSSLSATSSTISTSAAARETPSPTTPPTVKPLQTDPLADLTAFSAAERLFEALNKDLMTLARLADSSPPTQGETSQKLHDLTTAMRILDGQVSTFIAQYKPRKPS